MVLYEKKNTCSFLFKIRQNLVFGQMPYSYIACSSTAVWWRAVFAVHRTFMKDNDYQVVDLIVVDVVVDMKRIPHGHSRPIDFKHFSEEPTKKVKVASIIPGGLVKPTNVHGASTY